MEERVKKTITEQLKLEEEVLKLYSGILKECQDKKECTSEFKDLLGALINDGKRHIEVLKEISKKF